MKLVLRGMARQIRTLIRRTVVNSITGQQGKAQVAQIVNEGGAAIDKVEIFEPAGFTSRPPVEPVEGLLLARAGDSSQAILICVGARKYRLPVAAGESCIFNTPFGDFVKVKADRTIEVNANVRVDVNAPDVAISGNVTIQGDLTVNGATAVAGITSNGVNISSTHVHGGVMAGIASTGTPS